MKDRLTSYFLGDLSKEEEILLEEEYFSDDEKFLEFEATQNDLIDAYIENQLSLDQKEKFENYLKATPSIRHRVEVAKALSIHISRTKENKEVVTKNTLSTPTLWWQSLKEAFTSFSLVWRFAFVSSIAITFLVLTWRYFEQERLKQLFEKQQELLTEINKKTLELTTQKETINSQEQKINSQETQILQLKESLDKEKQSNPQEQIAQNNNLNSPILSFVLEGDTATLTRDEGGEEQKIKLFQKLSGNVQFKLKLPKTSLKPTQLALKASGKNDQILVWQENNLDKNSKKVNVFLIIEIPSNSLNENSYTLELNSVAKDGSITTIEEYSFFVRKN